MSRDTIHQSSNGGNAVNLAGGATYDVLIAVGQENLLAAANNLSDVASASTARTNLDVPGLSSTNTLTGINTFSRSDQISRPVELKNSAAASTSNRNVLRFLLEATAGTLTAFNINASFSDIGSGTEDTSVTFNSYDGGTFGPAFRIAGRSLQDASGNAYDAFPSGTKLLFGTTPPTGWTRVNVTNSSIIRLSTSGDTIGATGGSDDIFSSWNTQNHTLTLSQIPSHNHVINFGEFTPGDGGTVASPVSNDDIGPLETDGSGTTNTAGGGGSHSHNMSTPYYEIAVWATKD